MVEIKNYKLEVTPDMEWCFANNQYIEINVTHWIKKLTEGRPDEVFYDIGANCGYYSVLVCDDIKQVYSFEPTPNTFNYISNNIKNNNIQNVKVIQQGISNFVGDSTINVYATCGNNSMYKRTPITHPALGIKGVEKISINTIDNLLATNPDMLPPTIIKIDIEGGELYVLQGAKETIKKYRPKIILEYADSTSIDAGYPAMMILNELKKYGYTVVGLSGDNDIGLYDEMSFNDVEIANIIALPEGKGL